jgi:hypothetical protein
MRLAFTDVEPTPKHFKYNKTFHLGTDFPLENLEVVVEVKPGYQQTLILL